MPIAEAPTGLLSTLQRGLRVLEVVAREGGEATAQSLSAETGIKRGTCYHLLRTLNHEGYVSRLPGGHYVLGPRVAVLQDGMRRRFSASPDVRRVLRDLRDRVNETSYIAGWQGDAIVLLDSLEGDQAVTIRDLTPGYRENAHARASCQAILAALPRDRARSFLASQAMPALTPKTLTTLDDVMRRLDETAKLGYAVDREEFSEEVCCVSAAFFEASGFPVGSFTVSVPAARFERKLDLLAAAVLDAAAEASRLSGYSGELPPARPD
jgi:IclR family transcriptional regulator, acetate operon repressor